MIPSYYDLIKIRIQGKQGEQFVGQFNFTEKQRIEHNKKNPKSKQISITDIGILAFGRFILYEPKRKKWFKDLKRKISENENTTKAMKTIINEIRVNVGRSPAIGSSKKYPEYWIITPPGSLVDIHGNQNKIRHVQTGHLNKSQIKLLENVGYDIFEKKRFTLQQLKSKIQYLKEW